MSEMRFDGRVAIVTGAGGRPGLGRAYARLLGARGAKVVVNDIGASVDGRGRSDNADAHAVAQEIVDDGGEAVADTHSVADEVSAKAAVQTALDSFGRLDIVVNNAGMCLFADIDQMTASDVRAHIDVHLMGTFWMCRAAWPHMRAARYGRIVNITSWAMSGMRQLSAYGAAKGGLFALTRTLAIEGAPHDIKCNSLSPSAATRMNVVTLREDSNLLKWMMTQPAELVAPVVAFLAHEECPVNGESLVAVGGNVRRVFLSQTEGYTDPNLTLEGVRDNFDQVMDPARSAIALIPEPEEEIDALPRPYQPS